MGNKKHLPMYGVGPFYVYMIIVVTIAAVIAGHTAFFESGIIQKLKIPSAVIGVLLIVFGIYLWTSAVFRFYWIFMTVLMKCTEEKWLKKLYDREYEGGSYGGVGCFDFLRC